MFVIKNEKGTYFQGNTAIGPRFGGTMEGAKKFETRIEAGQIMGTHSFAFALCDIEDLTPPNNQPL